MKRLLWSLLVIGGLLSAAEETELEFTEDGFIPLEILFKLPDGAGVSLSPDGKYLTGRRFQKHGKHAYDYVTFTYNLDNRKIKPIDDVFTHGVYWYEFASDNELIIRSTNHDLYRYNLDTEEKEIIVSGPYGTKINKHLSYCRIMDVLKSDPDHILFSSGIKGKFIHGIHQKFITKNLKSDNQINGVWKLNIHTGENEHLVNDVKQTSSWWLNGDLDVALAMSWPDMELENDGSFEDEDWDEINARKLFLIDDNQFSKELPIELGPTRNDMFTQFSSPVFSKSGKKLYYLSQIQTPNTSIMSLDLETMTSKVLKTDPNGNITQLIIDPYSKTLIGYGTPFGKGRHHYFDPGLQSIQDGLETAFPDDMPYLNQWDRNFERFVVYVDSSTSKGKYYLFDRKTNNLEPVYDPAPWLTGYTFSPMQVIQYEARDGLAIEGYLTLPANQHAKAPYPMVLLVHGGPWQMDTWGFNGWVQFLADRGYAVLQVNFRGSEGYGLEFMNMADEEWGKTMQDDLTDAVNWAIQQGHADRNCVAIMGASYGGYATVMGLIKTPELFKAGIAMAGLYDLTSRLEELEHYYGDDAEFSLDILREKIGDPEKNYDALKATSPIFHVNKIQAPILVTHGHEDRVVRIDQSFNLVRKLRDLNKVHDKHYLNRTGHSYGSEERRTHLGEKIEEFLREHMPSALMK